MADKAQSAVDGLLALTLEGSEEKGDEIPSRRQAEVKNLDVPPLDDALLLSRHRFSSARSSRAVAPQSMAPPVAPPTTPHIINQPVAALVVSSFSHPFGQAAATSEEVRQRMALEAATRERVSVHATAVNMSEQEAIGSSSFGNVQSVEASTATLSIPEAKSVAPHVDGLTAKELQEVRRRAMALATTRPAVDSHPKREMGSVCYDYHDRNAKSVLEEVHRRAALLRVYTGRSCSTTSDQALAE